MWKLVKYMKTDSYRPNTMNLGRLPTDAATEGIPKKAKFLGNVDMNVPASPSVPYPESGVKLVTPVRPKLEAVSSVSGCFHIILH